MISNESRSSLTPFSADPSLNDDPFLGAEGMSLSSILDRAEEALVRNETALAEGWLVRATALADGAGRVDVVRVAKALAKTGADAERIESLFRTSIHRNSSDRLLVEDYIDQLSLRLSDAEINDQLFSMVSDYPSPIRSLLATLVNRVGHSVVYTKVHPHLAQAIESTPAVQANRQVWEDHVSRRRPDPAACAVVLANQDSASWLYFTFGLPPIEQIALYGLTQTRREALETVGIDCDRLAEYVKGFLQFGTHYWSNKLSEVDFRTEEQRKIVLEREVLCGFKDRIVESRKFSFMDPFTGDMLAPIDCVIIFGRTLYTFAGQELFYLISGDAGNDAFGLYIPRHNLSISFRERMLGGLYSEQMIGVRSCLVTRLARFPDRFAAAVAAPPAPDVPRRIIITVGHTDNFAHHVWNFYSAVQRLIEADIHHNIDEVHFSGTEFFGSLPDLFPEIAKEKFRRPVKNNVVDPAPFDVQALVVPAGGWFVSRGLSDRIVQTAYRLEKPEAAAHRLDLLSRHSPVVWLGIRLGDKAYEYQETGIPKIIDRIHARFPNAIFLVDGFSVPVGLSQIPDHWTDFLAKMRGVVQTIVSRTSCPDQVVDLVGNTLADSSAWARATDVYLAPLGTTQHKVGWLTEAPGIVYAPPSFAGRYAKTPGFWAAEISAMPDCVIGVAVKSGERRGYARSRQKMANIDLDTDSIADRLIVLLEERLAGAVTSN